jgi:hypothetical protein
MQLAALWVVALQAVLQLHLAAAQHNFGTMAAMMAMMSSNLPPVTYSGPGLCLNNQTLPACVATTAELVDLCNNVVRCRGAPSSVVPG